MIYFFTYSSLGVAIGFSQCGSNIGQLLFALLIPYLLENSEVLVSKVIRQDWMWKWCPWMLVSWSFAVLSLTCIACAFMIQELESKKVLKKVINLKSQLRNVKFLMQNRRFLLYCISGFFSYMASFIPLFLLAKATGILKDDVSSLIIIYGMYYLWYILLIIKICTKYLVAYSSLKVWSN